LNTNEYDNYLATIGAIKSVFNLPESDWDGNAITLGYKSPSVNATPDTVIVRDATGSAAIAYSNSEMIATTVVGALDELQLTKADVSALTSNIKLYATTADADVSGYKKMVSSLDDPAYNTTAVDIPTGAITTTGQLIASLVADAGLFVGNPGVISITTIGKIKKTAGNENNYGEFYFEVYKRTEEGVETLQVTSDTTGLINFSLNNYREFSANALLNNGIWAETDRVVIKYYANALLGTAAQYSFEFGGANPVRTLLPVPVSVIPIADATGILTDVTNFNNILGGTDDTVQKALDKLDDHNHDGDYAPLVNDKIPADYLPSVALTDTFVVANTTEMTGLNVQVGDIAIVTEISKTFILAADPASTLANWKEILTPADGIQSVTGSGAINVTAGVNPTVSVTSGFVVPTTSEKGNYDTAYTHSTLTNNPHSVTKTQVGLGNVANLLQATTAEYSGTITSGGWSGSNPFTKAVTVTGILSTDQPIIDLNLSAVAFANVPAVQEAWGKIYRAVTTANTITFSSTEALTTAISFIVKVVR
jgi:hypothetical protein